jgi:hypothetical protein
MSRLSSKVQCAKCQSFGQIFVIYTSKPLVIQEHKNIGKKKNYYVQVYKLNPEDFRDLDE